MRGRRKERGAGEREKERESVNVSYPPFSFSLLFLAAFLLLSFILHTANQDLPKKIQK